MALYRLQFYFQGPTQGWQENWYVNALSAQQALMFGQQTVPARTNLLGKYTFIQQINAIEVSLVPAVPINFVGRALPLQSYNINGVNAANVTDTGWLAVKIRIQCGPTYRRTMMLPRCA